jgi:hypothetical protein
VEEAVKASSTISLEPTARMVRKAHKALEFRVLREIRDGRVRLLLDLKATRGSKAFKERTQESKGPKEIRDGRDLRDSKVAKAIKGSKAFRERIPARRDLRERTQAFRGLKETRASREQEFRASKDCRALVRLELFSVIKRRISAV